MLATLTACLETKEEKAFFRNITFNSFASKPRALEYIWKHFQNHRTIDLNSMPSRWPERIQTRFGQFLAKWPTKQKSPANKEIIRSIRYTDSGQ